MENSPWDSLICTTRTFKFHFTFFLLPSSAHPSFFFQVSSGKVVPPRTSSSVIPFLFSTVHKLLVTHKILGARILALHNLKEPPHYSASSFQLFEVLLHLKAYIESKPRSKRAYIILLLLECSILIPTSGGLN